MVSKQTRVLLKLRWLRRIRIYSYSGLYIIYFIGSLAQRSEFTWIANFTQFHKKECAVRWCENGKLPQKSAINILQNLKLIFRMCQRIKGKRPTLCFWVIEGNLKDVLLLAKLAFFKTQSEDAESFLKVSNPVALLSTFIFWFMDLIMEKR